MSRHSEGQQLHGAGALEVLGPPHGLSGQGLLQQGPVQLPQPGTGQLGGTRAAPAPGIVHLPGDGNGLRLGWDVHLQVGLAQQHPWQDRAGL